MSESESESYWNGIAEMLFSLRDPLTDEQIESLEQELQKSPDSIELRIRILSAYVRRYKHSPRAVEITLWFMRHYPAEADIVFDTSYPFFAPLDRDTQDSFFEAESLWLSLVDENWDSPHALRNSTKFLELLPEKHEQVLLRLLEISPPDWHSYDKECLFKLYCEQAEVVTGAARKERGEKAYNYFQQIETELRERASKSEYPSLPLAEAARSALYTGRLDDAKKLADEILQISEWPYPQDATPQYHREACNLLGLVDLANGDIEGAKLSLKKLGSIKSPKEQQGWLSSDSELAQALLDIDERECVYQYLLNYPNTFLCSGIDAASAAEAVRTSKKFILNTDKRKAMHHAHKGYFLAKKGHTDRARTVLSEVRDLAIDDGFVYYSLGILEAQLGEAEQALASLAQALKLEPSLSENAIKSAYFSLLKSDPRFEEIIKSCSTTNA